MAAKIAAAAGQNRAFLNTGYYSFMKTVLMAMALAACCGAAERPRVLILSGESDYPFHDWRSTTPFLRGLLGRCEVKVAEEPRGLTAATLAGYDVLVLNYNGPRWGADTERAIEDFVRAGKGLVGVHGISYGTFFGMERRDGKWRAGAGAGWVAYPDLIGSSWKPENIGHAPRQAFDVKWVDREHPVAQGMGEHFLANDELYHRMDLRPNARVIASAYDDPATGGTGKPEPMIWATAFGKGRTVHITLGHDTAAMYQPGFGKAFARSVEWAATGAVTPAPPMKTDAVRVLVATGGHAYPPAFYTLFEGYDDIRWSHATTQPQAFNAKMNERYDVLVLHDMYNEIGEPQRAALKAFVDAGKGVVSIHHSIVDYTAWPWWHEEVIGGKYDQKKSTFKEDVEVIARPVKGQTAHPVIAKIGPLTVEDEVYKGMWHSPNIKVLMETDHPLNDRPVVYIGPNPKARAVYIQLGHSESTMRNPGYRRLVRQAILWAAGK